MSTVFRVMLIAAALGTGAGTLRAQERVTDLLGWVPSRTNLVLFVDADALGKSAIAKKEKWGTSGEPVSGLDTLPPGVSQLVVASQFEPRSGPSGEAFVVRLKKPMSDADLLKGTGGTTDKIAGKNVVLTPNSRFVANLKPGIAGGYQPANRQDMGRWLREANGEVSPKLSPLLAIAGAGVGANTPVVLVLDTSDMFSPALVKTRLAATATFKDKAAKIGPVADLFGQLHYVTVSISATDKLAAELRLEFGAPAAPLDGAAQPLMLEVLKGLGFHSAEMDQWAATVRGSTVTFSGPLTKESANDLLSPFLQPSLGAVDQPAPEVPAEQVKLQASKKYFQAVQKKMGEVQKNSPPTFQKLTAVLNNGARYIEELPLLNVDEELLQWGAALATTLRTMAVMSQKAGGAISLAEANRAMSTVSTPNYYTGGGYVGGYYGGYGWNYAVPSGSTSTAVVDNYATVNNIQTVTSQNEALYRRETWQAIQAGTLDLRRKMVKKYNAEF
ncbi:hypothetical protein J8F10_17190 [Gemmata sp. G18]|uniref:VWA domain-containing protein n=1 Tax=Gemmata palustris TaxID=2822762 RepID=A0ABS5BTF8_9BACT|nr:hypothetical protein [Gemmata palustris]MBP3957007.1 hypothetical protein [Gemmata palustris]